MSQRIMAAYGSNSAMDNDSVDSEDTFLIRGKTPTPVKKKVRYRLNWLVRSRCACLIVVLVGLAHTFDPSVIVSEDLFSKGMNDILLAIYTGCSIVFYLFYPITGLYADVKFGRYKTGVCSLCLALASCLTTLLSVVLYGTGIETTGLVLFSFGYNFGMFARTSFMIVMLSFGADQLLGASSEELSAYVQWFYLSHVVGWAISGLVNCLLRCIVAVPFDMWLIMFGFHTLCIFICLLVMTLYKKKMVTERPKVSISPMTLIFRVLKYAKTHRYPANRSAFTYWEDNYPSRIDLGKQKYGGPFAEDQVQDVKTLLKVTPFIVCMLIFFVLSDGHSYFSPVETGLGKCLLSSLYFLNCSVTTVTIIINVTVLIPFFYKCYPSMLKRIGFGIFLCVVSSALWPAIDLSARLSSTDSVNKYECLIDNDTVQDVYNTTVYSFTMVPRIIENVAFGIIAPTSLEFAFAQAPYSMRGVVIGVWFMTTGFAKAFAFSLLYPFGQLKNLFQLPCEFYLFGTKFVIVATSFFCFVCLSFRYKLRFRGDRFDQYQAVKKSYANYLKRSSVHEENVLVSDSIDQDSIDRSNKMYFMS